MPTLDNYKNDGWGLTRLALEQLQGLLIQCLESGEKVNILEFGSGSSTRFFVDAVIKNQLQDKVSITSFDDNWDYMPNFEGLDVSSFLSLHQRDLVECDDESFEAMFQAGQYQAESFHAKQTELHTRQRNNFYHIGAEDLQGSYDIVVLDGPHGNGRSIAFLHLLEHLAQPTYVLVDDHTHHDFEQRMLGLMVGEKVFENRSGKATRLEKLGALFSASKREALSQWQRGGDFAIYRLTGKRS